MGAVSEALDVLTEDERGRVLRWAGEEFGVSVTPAGPAKTSKVKPDVDDEDLEPDHDEDPDLNDKKTFGHFAELYDAYSPQNDAERALIGGYWQQVILGKPTFMAGQVNKELRDLGHAITAINKAMITNMKKKPALILQLKRSGTTQQARKTLKLSGEGVRSVETRLRRK